MKRTIVMALFAVLLASAIGAAESFGNPGASKTVLIAKEDTGYKKRLIRKLIEKLDDGTVAITVVDHTDGELAGIDPTDFDAVFITNSGAQAQVRPAVIGWLENLGGADENVVLHTTQITKWEPPVEVDSITSASQRSNIDQVTDDILRRLHLHL